MIAKSTVSTKQLKMFKKKIYTFYKEGKRDFPWRKTKDPYRILISEYMLQQTQAERVIPKYTEFLGSFPTIQTLARATLPKVMKLWQGLGYNRRAKYLHTTAKIIVQKYNSTIPTQEEVLQTLPGIGSYTAAAIRCFAYNKPTMIIETNIRSVFIHHFFKNQKQVHDEQIISLIKKTCDLQLPRKWYYALMDYGSMLKQRTTNPNRKSTHYSKQSPFKGSDRQIRGIIIRILLKHHTVTIDTIIKTSGSTSRRITKILQSLVQEKLIMKEKNHYRLYS